MTFSGIVIIVKVTSSPDSEVMSASTLYEPSAYSTYESPPAAVTSSSVIPSVETSLK